MSDSKARNPLTITAKSFSLNERQAIDLQVALKERTLFSVESLSIEAVFPSMVSDYNAELTIREMKNIEPPKQTETVEKYQPVDSSRNLSDLVNLFNSENLYFQPLLDFVKVDSDIHLAQEFLRERVFYTKVTKQIEGKELFIHQCLNIMENRKFEDGEAWLGEIYDKLVSANT